MKQKMKQSFAKKLTAKLATLIFVIMALLIIGSYSVVSEIVQSQTAKYNASLAGVLSDVIWQEARNKHVPIDENMAKYIDYCCDYICKWYHVDYVYIYSLSKNDNTIKLLGFSFKESDRQIAEKSQHAFGKIITLGNRTLPENQNGLIGAEIYHIPTAVEEQIWSGKLLYYSLQKSNRFEPALESLCNCTNDGYGNKVVVVTGIFTREIQETITKAYLPFVLIIFCVFILMTVIIYFLIRHSVFRPIQKLAASMKEFITDGKRSKITLDISTNDEFALMASAFNTMSDNIDKYIKENNQLTIAEARSKTEAKIASAIQQGLLAPSYFTSQDFEVVAKMVPAKDVGGDLYEYFDLGDGRVLLTIGDVSGKGYASSFYMAIALVLIHQYAMVGLSPAKILENVNDTFCDRNPTMFFITAFVGIFDTKRGVLTYSNAGHNPPYVLRNKLEQLQGAQNILLGLYKDEKYTEEEVPFSLGDILFLYTDGVNEAINALNIFFGVERLEKVLGEFRNSHEKNLVKYVYNAVRNFIGGADQSDDITMLAFMPKHQIELYLAPDVADFSRIKEAILSSNLPRQLQLLLCVAVEEIFVNICSYAFQEEEKIGQKVRFVFEHSDRIVVRFEDGGVPYDPTKNVIDGADYNPDEQIGGLGRLIAFTIADEVIYARVNETNILTITKFLKEENK